MYLPFWRQLERSLLSNLSLTFGTKTCKQCSLIPLYIYNFFYKAFLRTLSINIIYIKIYIRYSPSEWLKQSMHKKVILKIIFPKLNSKDYTFCSYKITPRRTNAHAYVNSAMKIRTTEDFIVR